MKHNSWKKYFYIGVPTMKIQLLSLGLSIIIHLLNYVLYLEINGITNFEMALYNSEKWICPVIPLSTSI